MKLRCELHLDGELYRIILVAKPEEKLDHLALKLAGFAMFHPLAPMVEPSSDHPALLSQTHKPDMFALNEAGEITLWVECGAVTLVKLDKVTRRLPHARVVVLKTTLAEAERLRKDLADVRHANRIEIWTWPEGGFKKWLSALDEKIEIFGEAHEKSFNLVVNNHAYSTDLLSV